MKIKPNTEIKKLKRIKEQLEKERDELVALKAAQTTIYNNAKNIYDSISDDLINQEASTLQKLSNGTATWKTKKENAKKDMEQAEKEANKLQGLIDSKEVEIATIETTITTWEKCGKESIGKNSKIWLYILIPSLVILAIILGIAVPKIIQMLGSTDKRKIYAKTSEGQIIAVEEIDYESDDYDIVEYYEEIDGVLVKCPSYIDEGLINQYISEAIETIGNTTNQYTELQGISEEQIDSFIYAINLPTIASSTNEELKRRIYNEGKITIEQQDEKVSTVSYTLLNEAGNVYDAILRYNIARYYETLTCEKFIEFSDFVIDEEECLAVVYMECKLEEIAEHVKKGEIDLAKDKAQELLVALETGELSNLNDGVGYYCKRFVATMITDHVLRNYFQPSLDTPDELRDRWNAIKAGTANIHWRNLLQHIKGLEEECGKKYTNYTGNSAARKSLKPRSFTYKNEDNA